VAVPDPRGRPPELLGSAGAAQLPAAGVQRRRAAWWHVHEHRHRPHGGRRTSDDAAV